MGESNLPDDTKNSFIEAAVRITQAQAAVRSMQPDEVKAYLTAVVSTLQELSTLPASQEVVPDNATGAEEPIGTDWKKSIKGKTIVCLECGKSYKVLSTKHLMTHGLTSEQYKEKYGIPQKTALASKGISKQRRDKMRDMKLWERRGKKDGTPDSTEKKAAKKRPAQS